METCWIGEEIVSFETEPASDALDDRNLIVTRNMTHSLATHQRNKSKVTVDVKPKKDVQNITVLSCEHCVSKIELHFPYLMGI